MSQRRNSNSSLQRAHILASQTASYGSLKKSHRHNHHGSLTPIQSIPSDNEVGDYIDQEDLYESDGYSVSIHSSYQNSLKSLDSFDDVPVSIKDELASIIKSAVPLSLTFFFEYLLAVNSLFLVGHLGSNKLASASLAVMTFNITGMAVFEGMSTCLDTFCSQAYGAKKYERVGLYFQRCTAMILTLSIPILLFWWYSKWFLSFIVPEQELLDLTQLYLRILCLGAPGLIGFETGKRYLQAQKIFHASTYVLFICLPVNLLLNYILIRLWGFIGAPIAIVITYWLMSLLLLLYVIFVDGKQCWTSLSSRAFKHWRPMLDLALPGLAMIESEYLSFEVLTIMASYFGTDSLAAQSIVSNIGSLTYQFPFAIGCAISTRIAIYIGGRSIRSSKVSVRLAYGVAFFTALLTFSTILIFRRQLALLFSSDETVIELAVKSMPILALNQFSDTFNIISAGILRSQGRQKIGSVLNLVSYYAVALPLAYVLSFKFDLKIVGLWLGLGSGIFVLAVGETFCVIKSNWKEIIRDSINREDEDEVLIDDNSTIASSASSLMSTNN